ncbi:MAG: MarR family winged helix-turn-helix transcriptional regulator [Thermoleophilaceae bacterium]
MPATNQPTQTSTPRGGSRHLAHLLADAKDAVVLALAEQMRARGYGDIRPSHGCVFRFIDPVEGSRLTYLAERGHLTKQAVGEMVSDLEQLGYVERVPDPSDGRAKLVRLTALGRESHAAALECFAAIEAAWAERFGLERVTEMRRLLEQVTAEDLRT